MKRRDFLKSAGVGAAALAIVPVSLISAEKISKPLSASVEYKKWDRPIYPDVRDFLEKGIVHPKGFSSDGWDGNDRDKYHLLSYVPNKHEDSGYSLCRRTYIMSNPSQVTLEHIKISEMKEFRIECERVLKSPENYVYIKEL